MKGLQERLRYLLTSTNGLTLTAIAMIMLVTTVWGTLSGPMAEWGIKDITVELLGMELDPAAREGRLVMLYHTIALAMMAIMVYLITANVRMRDRQVANINGTVTVGYLTALVFGLGYAYFGQNPTFHGLFLLGLSLVFAAGVQLAVAPWPWQDEYRLGPDSPYARTAGGLDLERTAFWTMAVSTLGSAMLGAWAGSHWGFGFSTFLAEDIIRLPHKNALQLAVIGHLHIMLALMGIAITLIIGRWFDFRGVWHRIAMPCMILGTAVLTLGAWAVVPYQVIAHWIIYVGATFSMLAALFLVIYGLPKLVHDRLAEQGVENATLWQKTMALFHDPLKFGSLWQMIFMNFNVSGVGIFMAVKLDDLIRVWDLREERIELVGHWHVLAALIATITLFYVADRMGLQGKARQWFGWTVIIGSDVAFGAITAFELKRLFVSEYTQQPLVNTLMVLADIGLGAVMVIVGVFLIRHLADLFKSRGYWARYRGADRALLVILAVSLIGTITTGCVSEPETPVGVQRFIGPYADPNSWALVPSGPFLTGQYGTEAEIPYDFEIMLTEVTNNQYLQYLSEAYEEGAVLIEEGVVLGYYAGDEFNHGKHERPIDEGLHPYFLLGDPASRITFASGTFGVKPGYEHHPVTMVTWFGAKAYADHYGYRLPTELEWEKAARGTDGRAYPWGDDVGHGHANYYHSGDPFETRGGYSDTTPVGFYNGSSHDGFETVNSISPYGCYDMAGNAGEWVADIYYKLHDRWIKGGSKAQHGVDMRVWKWNSAPPDYASPSLGFRCARTP